MIKTKKGQVRMSENVAILFILFVLIIFGIIFFYQYQKIAVKEKQEELLAVRAMETTLRVLYLPELMCTKGEAEPEDNCFDMMKLRNIAESGFFQKGAPEKLSYYFDLFSYSKISLQPIYPAYSINEGNGGENAGEVIEEIVIYDREKTKTLERGEVVADWEQKEPTYFVVALKDQLTGGGEESYGFGYLTVEVYS